MHDLPCAACRDLCPEVALGAASAEDRADVLAHVERCAGCAALLRSMTDVGDGLAALVPPMEPPPGFEARVLSAIRERGGRDRPALGQRLRSRPLAVAAAVAAAVALAAGGWLVGETTSAPSSTAVTSALVSRQGAAGTVVLVSGVRPWISMTFHAGSTSGSVECEVQDASGRLVTLGTFPIVHGYGSWAGPLPQGTTVRGAWVVTPGGRMLAWSTISGG